MWGGENSGSLDAALAAVEQREVLRQAMARLDERRRQIIYGRFFEDVSQAEMAERLGISPIHVSRLERQSLQILRGLLTDRY